MQQMDKKGETCVVSNDQRVAKIKDAIAKDAKPENVCEKAMKQCNRVEGVGGVHHASYAIVSKPIANRMASPSLMLSSTQNKGSDVSFMQESSDFQWCLEEEEYQRSLISSQNTPRSVFEGSYLTGANRGFCATHSSNNYEVISRNIDANLAEIDMETFKSEDINAILTLPTILSRESTSVQQQGGEEFASVSDSLLQEIEFDSQNASQVSCESFAVFAKNEPLFSSRREYDIDYEESPSRRKRAADSEKNGISRTIAVTDLSVDSLDMSLEENTNEVVMRCVEQDKTKYTIAFEESLSSLTFTDSNGEEERKNCEESDNNKKNDMIRSDHSYVTWNRLQRNLAMNNNYNDQKTEETATKQSKSLPNIVQVSALGSGQRGEYGLLPLYDLNTSPYPSTASELSAPRSLIRLFIQNHVSPSTSAETSASMSFESHSQESGAGGSASSTSTPTKGYTINIGLQAMEEANNNRRLDNRYNVATTRVNDEDNVFEDSLIIDEASTLPPPKAAFNRLKTSPIKEEDEPLSDSSRADVTMRSDTETDVQTVYQKDDSYIHSNNSNDTSRTRRSSSVDCSTQPLYDPNTNRLSFDGNLAFNANRNFRTTGLSKEHCSSSGYSSIRQGSTEWMRKAYHSPVKSKSNANLLLTNTRTASTQVPVHIQDKQVQTSLTSSKSMDFVLKEKGVSNANERRVPLRDGSNSTMKPFYVCYPNYSLPDLSFLGDLAAKSEKVILSPTKFKLPMREPVSMKIRAPVSKGVRPKSCTDYEKLTKQNFSHIKDWDSLKVLLPNEFKTLIERLKGMNEAKEEKSSSLSSRHPGVRFRSPQKRMARKPPPTATANSEAKKESNCGCNKNKRFSLQEPFDPGYYLNLNTSPLRKKTMSKSATMPCHCLCQWHYSHCCSCYHHHCYNACHSSHCHFSSSPQAIKEATVDQLSEMISMDMTLKEVTNIIGGHSNRMSPTLAWEPICEQNEEFSFRRVDEDCNSFKELRKHWEAIATSPGNAPKNSVLSAVSRSKSPETKTECVANTQKSLRKKPQIPEKPVQCTKKVQQCGRPALRPSTLNTQNFKKSMIPIAKGSKSPPGGTKGSPTANCQ